MEKIEYEVKKDEDFLGKRFATYTIIKKIVYENGETEVRFRTFIPFRDGDINKVDFNTLDFPKPITDEEWEFLPKEYRKAWINGTMTKELYELGEYYLNLIRTKGVLCNE